MVEVTVEGCCRAESEWLDVYLILALRYNIWYNGSN